MLLADLFARIGCRNDLADTGLIEPLEPGVALEVFQMRANRALLAELLRLLLRDVAAVEGALDALGRDLPAFAFGEGLAEVREIREGLHRLHTVLALELVAK